MEVKKSLKVKIFPTSEQAIKIDNTIHSYRFVYNQTLTECVNSKAETGHYTSKIERSARLVTMKKEFPWLSEVEAAALQQSVKDFDMAMTFHFKNPKHYRFPVLKKRHKCKWSYRTPYHGGRSTVVDCNTIKISKVGIIKTKNMSLPKEYKILNITIEKTTTGKYFASICLTTEVNELPKTGKQGGFDLGLTDLLVCSDGTKIKSPKYGKNLKKQLATEQSKLSKMRNKLKKVGVDLDTAKNYQKQKHKVMKIYAHMANQRKDFNHKLSKWLVENYDVLAFENLNITGLLKNHTLAYSISDASWGQLLRMVEYKSLWYGKKFIKIDRFYASSKICSNCGIYHKDIVKDLSIREWDCPDCGVHHDRDINAAKNILNYALSVA